MSDHGVEHGGGHGHGHEGGHGGGHGHEAGGGIINEILKSPDGVLEETVDNFAIKPVKDVIDKLTPYSGGGGHGGGGHGGGHH